MKKTSFSESIKPLNRESVSSTIMNMVTNYLLTNALKPGDKLPTESELAQQLGVGRNTVREAIKMLYSLGVIEIKRGVGTFIPKSMSASVVNPLVLGLVFEQGTSKELIELRLLIDNGAAELAMQKASNDDIKKLEDANMRLKEAAEGNVKDSQKLRDLDLNFHLTLLEITKNRLLIKIGKATYNLFMASIEKSLKEDSHRAFRNHQLVIDAIKKRNSRLIKRSTRESLAPWISLIGS